MTNLLLIIVLILLAGTAALVAMLLRRTSKADASVLASRLDVFEKIQERTEKAVRDEAGRSRDELGKSGREQREELADGSRRIAETTSQQLNQIRDESVVAARQLREELSAAITRLSALNEKKLEEVRVTVEGKLNSMQLENTKQLDQMRQTVDEKLQSTLEKRLGESFKQVSDRLEQVHKGLGEMQTLATGVGDLKKVLTNVKTRGTWGEVQLGVLLEQVLTPDQFAANVATSEGGERVEFAIKLPGQGVDRKESIWLPIDAKFPIEAYQRLIDAQEGGDLEGVDTYGKQLENRVKDCAADISRKYLNPPKTTDFGILFLPIEGLFAEVIRRSGLMEAIQRDCRVVIAGPTTLWSILSSLQLGFRTLAIQERSSEVWNLLGAVKTEWTKYGAVLDAVQKKLNAASETIEKAKTRSRAVGRKLRDVQELPVGETKLVLSMDPDEDDNLEDDDEAIEESK